jgi:DNA processing protein
MTSDGPMPASAPFTGAQRLAWLRLWRSENIGPRTFQTLLKRFGSAEAALEALPDLLRHSNPGRAIRIAAVADIEREMEVAASMGARFVTMAEAAYPKLLLEIDSPPAVIAVRGTLATLDRPAIGIVGARNASAAGLAFAERLARGLGQAGYVIVSGFARGIDSRAHRASLASGTIAVLAGGHDRLYPADQGPFLDRLLEDGAAISEMPFGWEARGRDFPRRNRLVSGLSLGVVVVEAARRSGSLITARFAADQGREVFAVPGSPLDPRAEGTNDLLRDGATFCCDVDDVLRALADRVSTRGAGDLFSDAAARDDEPLWDELDLSGKAPSPAVPRVAPIPLVYKSEDAPMPGGLKESAHRPVQRVVDKLGPTPISIDELGRAADLAARDVRAALLELELAGRIERHGGGLVSLIMGD